ncbi:hypothetical protein ACFVH9_08465 [Streptomyces hirsutus]|uniref:hypothetical protein n=1 Tax=Streptomyces hirsutus TaxID=35620 RepID=UPI00362FBC03
MTAGPDERTLQVIPGGAGVDQPAQDDRDDEERVRQDLLRLMGVGPYAAAGPPPPYPPAVPAPSVPVDVDQEPEEEADYEGFSDWLRAKRAARQEPQDPEPDDDGEDEPAAPARAANRLPDWWRTDKPHLGDADEPGDVVAPDGEDEPGDVAEKGGQGEAAEPKEQEPGPTESVKAAPVLSGLVQKVTGGPKRTPVRKSGEGAAGDRRLRGLAFNGTAAGLGWVFGLVDAIAIYLPAAEQAATGVFSLVLAAGGGWAAWKFGGTSVVHAVFKEKTVLFRVIVTGGTAEIGRRLAPVPVAYLNAYGQEWGLGPSTVSLLITTVGICGCLWWFIDRRIRHWHWGYRWLFRVPLSSALFACLPYSNGPVV